MHRLRLYVGSRDIKMEQLKFYELLIMSVQGYPHVYDKSKSEKIIKIFVIIKMHIYDN